MMHPTDVQIILDKYRRGTGATKRIGYHHVYKSRGYNPLKNRGRLIQLLVVKDHTIKIRDSKVGEVVLTR